MWDKDIKEFDSFGAMPKTFGFAINLWESPWSSPQRLSQRDASGNRSIKLQRSDEFTMNCLGTFFPGKFHGFDPFIHVQFVLGLSYASLLFFVHELSTFDVTHRCIGHSPEGGKKSEHTRFSRKSNCYIVTMLKTFLTIPRVMYFLFFLLGSYIFLNILAVHLLKWCELVWDIAVLAQVRPVIVALISSSSIGSGALSMFPHSSSSWLWQQSICAQCIPRIPLWEKLLQSVKNVPKTVKL